MADFGIEKFNKKGIEWSGLKDGVKKDSFTNDKNKLIFDLLDSDKNEVLDYAEVMGFRKQYKTDKNKDFLNKSVIAEFYKNNKAQLEPLGIRKEDLEAFFLEYMTNGEEIEGTQNLDNNSIEISYKNGKKEVINPDLGSTVTYTDGNNRIVIEEYSVDKELKKKTVTYKTENGDTVTEEYDNANTLQNRTIEYNKDNILPRNEDFNVGSVTRTINGKIEVCPSFDNYDYINGERKIVSSEITLPDGKKEKINYSYNNGVETRTITNNNKVTVQHYSKGKLTDESITLGNNITEIEYNSSGEAENTIKYQLNGDKKFRLSQTKVVNGQKYEVKYDGKGRTKVIMQAGWDYAKLAQEFGVRATDVSRLNGSKNIPQAGQEMLVPGEFEADFVAVKCPQTAQQARAIGNAAEQALNNERDSRIVTEISTENLPDFDGDYKKLAKYLYEREGNPNPTPMQLLKRAEELKELPDKYYEDIAKAKFEVAGIKNPTKEQIKEKAAQLRYDDMKSGNYDYSHIRVSVTPKLARELAVENDKKTKAEIARNQKIKKNNKIKINGIVADIYLKTDGWIDRLNAGNIVDVITAFKANCKEDIVKFIKENYNQKDAKLLIECVLLKLKDAAKHYGVKIEHTSGLSEIESRIDTKDKEKLWNGITYFYNNTDKAINTINSAISEITAAKNAGRGVKVKDSIQDASQVLSQDFNKSSENLKQYEKDWNWADWTGDAIYGFFGGIDTIDNKKAQWKKYSKDIEAMKNAKTYKEFNAAYFNVFHKNFNPALMKAKIELIDKLKISYQLKAADKVYTHALNDVKGLRKYVDSDTIYYEIAGYLNLKESELRNLVQVSAYHNGLKYEGNETNALIEYLRTTKNSVALERSKMPDIKSLEKELVRVESGLYGNNKTFCADIDEFNKGVKEGGMFVEMGVEIALTIALSYVGGAGLSAVLSGMNDLSKAAKLARLANYVSKINSAKNVTSTVINVGSAMGASATVQELTTGKIDGGRTFKSGLYAFIGGQTSKYAESLGTSCASKLNEGYAQKLFEKGITEVTEDTLDILSSVIVECGNYSGDDAVMDVAMNFVMSRFGGGSGRRAAERSDKEVTNLINKFEQYKNDGKLITKEDYIKFFENELNSPSAVPHPEVKPEQKPSRGVDASATDPEMLARAPEYSPAPAIAPEASMHAPRAVSVPVNNPYMFSTKNPVDRNSYNRTKSDITDESGKVIGTKTTITDGFGNPVGTQTEIKDDAGRVIKFTCTDENGNLTQNVDIEYDSNGRIIKKTITELNESAVGVRNGIDSPINPKDKEYRIEELTYDVTGRETGRKIRIEYSANNGNVKTDTKSDKTSTTKTQESTSTTESKQSKIKSNATENLINHYFPEFKEILGRIEDKKVKEYIESQLSSHTDLSYNECQSLYNLACAINEYNGLQVAFNDPSKYTGHSYLTDFRKNISKSDLGQDAVNGTNIPKVLENTQNANALNFDIVAEERIYSMREYMKENPNTEMTNYLYGSYYLKLLKENGTPDDILTRINDINKKYGTKLFVSGDLTQARLTLNYVEKELNAWLKASNGSAKIPPVIDFSSVKDKWYDPARSYLQGSAGGFSECYTNGAISFPGMTENAVSWAIRHEITHSNDTKCGKNIPDKYGDLSSREKMEEKLGKYKDEFRKAGISSEDHISYAYKNTLEFIAVASEGDMSKYSPEFKQVLLDFGMPEWEFNLEPVTKSSKSPETVTVKEKRPWYKRVLGKTYDEVTHSLQPEKIILTPPEILAIEPGAKSKTKSEAQQNQNVKLNGEPALVEPSISSENITRGYIKQDDISLTPDLDRLDSNILEIDLDGANDVRTNSQNAVHTYKSASNPHAQLVEYSYKLKNGQIYKFKAAKGLDSKNFKYLVELDLQRRNMLRMPKFCQYSENTQIRFAQAMLNNNSKNLQLKELLLAVRDEAELLKILKDKAQLEVKLQAIEQLQGIFKPNDFIHLGGLLEIKTTDPVKYQRIADSGLFDLIKDGKVAASSIKQIGVHADLSPEIYSDLALLKAGKSIVPEFPEGTDLNTAFTQSSIGDAVEVGNKMYINDGNQLVEWNMTKEKYLELFPPVQRFTTTQGSIGNCHLIQTLGLAMQNPKARAQFLQSFQMKGNDVVVTVKGLEDYHGSHTFPNGEITLASNNKHLTGCTGLQMYEQTYSKVALRENTDVLYPGIASINEVMTRSAWGHAAQTMADVFGKGNLTDLLRSQQIRMPDGSIRQSTGYSSISFPTICYKDNTGKIVSVDLNTQKNAATKLYVFNKFFMDFPDKTIGLKNLTQETTEALLINTAGNQDFMISFGTVSKTGSAAESKLLPEYNLVSNHAYSILGYDAGTKTVKIGNPHSYSEVTEIPLEVLHKYIGHLDFLKL